MILHKAQRSSGEKRNANAMDWLVSGKISRQVHCLTWMQTRTDGETRDLTIRKRLRSDDPKHVEPQKAQALVEETTSRDSVSTDGELGLSEKEKKAAKKARKAEKKARKAEKQERKTEKQERKAKMEQKSKGSRKSQTENNSDAAIKVGGTNPEVIHL